MTTIYDYSLTDDFSDNLNREQLKELIEEDVAIPAECYDVDSISGTVKISFDQALLTEEKTALDSLIASYQYTPRYIPPISATYEAVVDIKGYGDFISVAEAFNNGATSVFIRKGVYVETEDVVIPDGGQMIGEEGPHTILYFPGANGVVVDGSGGTKETTGTISATNGSATITGVGTSFTNLSPNNYILLGTNFFVIQSIETDTSLTLSKTYNGANISDEECFAQAMHTGTKIENLVITGSTSTGLYMRAVRHSNIKSVLTVACANNFKMIDSGDSSILELISSDSNGNGIDIDGCVSISLGTINSMNNMSNGINLLGKNSNIIFESVASENNNSYGVEVNGTAHSISITDSVLRYNKDGGINIASTVEGFHINGSDISNNTGNGATVHGENVSVSDCVISNNTGDGIDCDVNSILTSNHITDNTLCGIKLITGKCTVNGNRICGHGESGIYIQGNNNTVLGNISCDNTEYGIRSDGNVNIISASCVRDNILGGVYITGEDTVISSLDITGNTGNGLEFHTTAVNCKAVGNITTGNTADYVDYGTGTTVI